jgi:hypothetical protein
MDEKLILEIVDKKFGSNNVIPPLIKWIFN